MSMTRSDETGTATEREGAAAPALLSLKTAWEVIDDARRARITGELALTTASPAKTKVYLDSGRVYFAERETDETLATRLVLAGAIDPDQLHRGSLRLNGVEHLGRLFERDATVERDAVELALELMTEQTLTEVAEQEVLSSHITMYRQHSTGVARWFMSPIEATQRAGTDEPNGLKPSPWQPPSSPAVSTQVAAIAVEIPVIVEQTGPRVLPTLPPASLVPVSRSIERPSMNRLAQAVAVPLTLVLETPDEAAPAPAVAEVEQEVQVHDVEVIAQALADDVVGADADAADTADVDVDLEVESEVVVPTIEPEADVESGYDVESGSEIESGYDVESGSEIELDLDVTAEIETVDAADSEPADSEPVAEHVAHGYVVESLADVVGKLDASVPSKNGSVLHSLTPLTSLKAFMPIASAPTDTRPTPTQPTATQPTPTQPTAAVANGDEAVPVPAPSVSLQRASANSLQPMTRQPMTPLQPMNLQSMTPQSSKSATSQAPAAHMTARSSKPGDPDLSSIPVPEDVAAAVRRAIEAIENAMQEPRSAGSVTFGPLHVTAPGQPSPMQAQAQVAPLESYDHPITNGSVVTPQVQTEPTLQAIGGKSNAILSFGELSGEGAVYPLPVLPPLAPRGNRAPASEQRRGALRRLIAGVRRR